MLNIRQFLFKFKKLDLDKESQKKMVLDVLNSLDIPVEDITIKGKTVKIKASSIVKNQIFIKKQQILEKLPDIAEIN